MKVLFIGGTGIISSAVSRLAIERGVELYLLNRGHSQRPTPEGAQVLPSSSVFDGAHAPRRRTRGRYPAASAGLPKGANRITEELKNIWLANEDEE